MLPVRPSIPPAHKMSLDNTKKKDTEQEGGDATTTASAETVMGKVGDRKHILYLLRLSSLRPAQKV